MAMTICDEAVDMSCMNSRKAKVLNEAIGCTDVGPVRDQLKKKSNQCMLAELVKPPGLKFLVGSTPQGMTIMGRMMANLFSTMAARLVYCHTQRVIIGSTTRLPRHGQG